MLFEVRVLHDYYLYGLDPEELEPDETKEDKRVEKSFFSMSAAGQAMRLQELLRSGRYDIRKELAFRPGAVEESLVRGLHLRVITTATGFSVGMEVKPVETGGSLRFRPVITPPAGTMLNFAVVCVNSGFGGRTNLRAGEEKIYFFTNDGEHDGASLSTKLRALENGRAYQMGDRALIAGEPSEAIAPNDGDRKYWVADSGAGLVHQEDRRLGVKEPWFQEWRASFERFEGSLLGIIRISFQTDTGQLDLLDQEGFLTTRAPAGGNRPVHPVFELRFGGRLTYWRYRKMGGFLVTEAAVIEEKAGELLERSGGEFVTKKPRRFAEEMPRLVPNFAIPNAQPGLFRVADGKLYSEVYFNDVPKTK
jgi:hypothetical protein